MLRIALVHDYIKEYGGAERVLEALHEVFPDAPVFTTVYLPEFLGPHRERFTGWEIKTSFLQFSPLKNKLISPIRLVAPFVFKTFDFSQYDIVIVSATGAYSPNNISKNGAIQICYSHTPPRYLYGFATAREWKNNWAFRILGELVNHFLRLVDYKSSQNVDHFIANSQNVAGRIKKFYKRDATVIYPPVETAYSRLADSVELKEKKLNPIPLNAKRYYLAGGRIARPKNIELIIETFGKLKLPLKVFGRSFGGLNIPVSKYSNVQMLGEVTDEEKFILMRNAKAFIFASEDEDFGITPVEAMAMGTPVIAYRSGGVLESIAEGATGLFFDELSIESLSNAIKKFDKIKFDSIELIKHAQKFGKERFKREIKEFVEKKLHGNS